MVNKKSNNLSIDKYIISRVVMSYNGTNKIDHINHDLKDNRKSNLRIVTTSQNGMNRCIGINNTSGYVGVHQLPSGNWKARIQYNGNRINLGVFKNKEDAIKARKEAEEKYFGEYSLNNSMKNSN